MPECNVIFTKLSSCPAFQGHAVQKGIKWCGIFKPATITFKQAI